jgi:hypothetical protein
MGVFMVSITVHKRPGLLRKKLDFNKTRISSIHKELTFSTDISKDRFHGPVFCNNQPINQIWCKRADMVEVDVEIENPTLLSRSELRWLLGKSSASKTFQYKMLSNIRRKVQALVDIDLPLLMKNNLLSFELGRDLEPMITPASPVQPTQALVRQRSRVQTRPRLTYF